MTSIFTMWRSHPERLPARLDGKAGQDERQAGSRRVPALSVRSGQALTATLSIHFIDKQSVRPYLIQPEEARHSIFSN